jgi:hypothetical protein
MFSEATPIVWFSPVEPLHPFLIERRNRSPVLDELFSLPFAERDLAQLTRILEHPVALKFIPPLMLVRVTGGELRARRARAKRCAKRSRERLRNSRASNSLAKFRRVRFSSDGLNAERAGGFSANRAGDCGTMAFLR